jgi:NDP-sugar pyrophosphorylase family protein
VLPVVVLAGGLGTRLTPVTGDAVAKVLVPVAGRPFLEHKLEGLAALGAADVLLLVGHHGEAVVDLVGDGSRFGLSVRCVHDGPRPGGTGGAVRAALPLLPPAFWVTYGDSLTAVDARKAEAVFAASDSDGLMTVLHNGGRLAPSNARVADGLVVTYSKDPLPPRAEHVDYGMLILTRRAFTAIGNTIGEDAGPFDLAVVLSALAGARRLVAFEVSEPFHDIGTVESLRATDAFLRSRHGQE